jgi:phosphoribosylcarboxyaminoimidazole (NCAIR) mutase
MHTQSKSGLCRVAHDAQAEHVVEVSNTWLEAIIVSLVCRTDDGVMSYAGAANPKKWEICVAANGTAAPQSAAVAVANRPLPNPPVGTIVVEQAWVDPDSYLYELDEVRMMVHIV